MPAISPRNGPVAVTGASGYIGSWIVRDLVEQGYQVRACVRDIKRSKKVDHLLAMNNMHLRGKIELWQGDLFKAGSYDKAFKGCAGVIHAGASIGHNSETPQKVYDGCFTEVRHVIESAQKAGTVKRFVFTSSFAAVYHPEPQGYVFTERDFCSHNPEGYKGKWTDANIPKDRNIAYAMAKERCEKMLYTIAEEDGSFEAMSILPVHVIGPIMCNNHDQPYSWQNCVKQMLQGKQFPKHREGRMLWNNVDVRDTARAHRLCLETIVGNNGSRYILSASDRSGELFTWELQAKLKELFPGFDNIGGEMMVDGKPKKFTWDSPRSYCLLAKQELGLKTYSINETLRATGDSYLKLGLLSQSASKL